MRINKKTIIEAFVVLTVVMSMAVIGCKHTLSIDPVDRKKIEAHTKAMKGIEKELRGINKRAVGLQKDLNSVEKSFSQFRRELETFRSALGHKPKTTKK